MSIHPYCQSGFHLEVHFAKTCGFIKNYRSFLTISVRSWYMNGNTCQSVWYTVKNGPKRLTTKLKNWNLATENWSITVDWTWRKLLHAGCLLLGSFSQNLTIFVTFSHFNQNISNFLSSIRLAVQKTYWIQ